MKCINIAIFGILTLLVTSCERKPQESDVVSQKYIHKYGYAVSQDEFEANHYPGQVITMLKNGVTITATYENGVLHGPCTHTFPNSQTIESYYLYNDGKLVKQLLYDIAGMPVREEVQLSPSRYSTTLWYKSGSPLCIEEFANQELLEGQYFTSNNDLESQVVKGKGIRVRRDPDGVLLYRDMVEEGLVTQRETLYPSGTPETIAYYQKGQLYGEKRSFTAQGEPLAIQEYIQGKLHGKSTFFKNGVRDHEIYFLDGRKNGLEIHYIDGNIVSQEILWENDKRHGPAKFYNLDGSIANIEYYYDGKIVSEKKWNEFSRLDEIVSQISPAARL